MKYAPRKVYIKESGGYVELSYTDFCRRKQSDQSYMDKLFIPVQGCLLEVVREQYADFYKDKERWRYLKKLDTNHSLLSLEGFTDSEGNVIDFVVDEAVDVAETVVHAVMVDRLKTALRLLSDSERVLVNAIFFEKLSEREVGLRLGVTQSVVNKRKSKILAKLRTGNQIYEVGIYCRLSKDDGTENESASIATQKSILTDYVKKQGWHLAKTYVDDGYSGTNFVEVR